MRDWTAFVRSRLSLPDLVPEREARIIRELAAQLEDFYRDARARGASEAEADAHARAQVGDWMRMARDVARADHRHARPPIQRFTNRLERLGSTRGRRSRPLNILARTVTDMRYGTRQLLKAPGFTLVAILTLAVGIGATSAIFSVVNGVMLRPLPYPEPEGIVRVIEVLPQYGRFAVAPANFLDWRDRNQVFERIAAYTTGNDTFIGSEGPERIPRALVSWDTFELLGVTPVLGRSFRKDEDLPNQNNVIVISHGMWQRRFGSDPNILGRAINISGAPVTIVGVMPAGFYFAGRAAEFWRPIALDPANASRGGHFLAVVARLKRGVSLQQAESEMRGIATQLAKQYPDSNADESADTVRLHDLIVGPIRPMLLTLFGAVGVLVLIACANVAHLLLVHASVRERELAIRTAMGAGRGRLVLQMIAESLVLALAGGAAGVLLAYLAIAPIQSLGANSVPRVADITLDRNVLAFAFVLTIATGFLFGLAPAWQAARGGVGAVLKDSGRSTGTRGHRVRGLLLVAEVALSLVLLVGAALLIRSFARLTNIDPGFAPDHVLAFQVALPRTAYPDNPRRDAFFDRLLERLRGTPGVQAAGMVQTLPILDDYMLSFSIQGRPPAAPGQELSANFRVASPGYFESLSIPVISGRTFTAHDTAKSPMVAVIDDAFARRHFPGENPIGRGIDIGNDSDGFYEVVGVVGSVRHEGLDSLPRPTMYIPYKQEIFSGMVMMVRTQGDPAQFAGTARQVVREIDPALPAFGIRPLSNVVTQSVAQRRFSMLLLGVFAFVAVFLAAVGLYGVVAYAVSQRTQEIGLRMAIGAQRGDVLRLVLGNGMKLALLGVAIGVGGALALSRYIATMLFEIDRFDAPSYAATAAVLLAVSALACYVPARRAMRVDPLVAMRAE
ncbi:MAG TPA: ABC transporter permease [Vicinamibacterales bacterium]|nr:ABC transporter permease [Vicinamibacterales bacterium]